MYIKLLVKKHSFDITILNPGLVLSLSLKKNLSLTINICLKISAWIK